MTTVLTLHNDRPVSAHNKLSETATLPTPLHPFKNLIGFARFAEAVLDIPGVGSSCITCSILDTPMLMQFRRLVAFAFTIHNFSFHTFHTSTLFCQIDTVVMTTKMTLLLPFPRPALFTSHLCPSFLHPSLPLIPPRLVPFPCLLPAFLSSDPSYLLLFSSSAPSYRRPSRIERIECKLLSLT